MLRFLDYKSTYIATPNCNQSTFKTKSLNIWPIVLTRINTVVQTIQTSDTSQDKVDNQYILTEATSNEAWKPKAEDEFINKILKKLSCKHIFLIFIFFINYCDFILQLYKPFNYNNSHILNPRIYKPINLTIEEGVFLVFACDHYRSSTQNYLRAC